MSVCTDELEKNLCTVKGKWHRVSLLGPGNWIAKKYLHFLYIIVSIYWAMPGLHCCVDFFFSSGEGKLLSSCGVPASHLEKEMATHSSILAWRIPGRGEPGGLPSMGSHRVGHDWSDLVCMHALEKEMATQSSILAWRIPGMGEPGGLPSMRSHRVGHDWSNLAAATAGFSLPQLL